MIDPSIISSLHHFIASITFEHIFPRYISRTYFQDIYPGYISKTYFQDTFPRHISKTNFQNKFLKQPYYYCNWQIFNTNQHIRIQHSFIQLDNSRTQFYPTNQINSCEHLSLLVIKLEGMVGGAIWILILYCCIIYFRMNFNSQFLLLIVYSIATNSLNIPACL